MRYLKISFEEKNSKEKSGSEYYYRSEIFLKINDDYFDPDIKTKYTKSIQKKVHNGYWDRIRKLCSKGHRIVIKISDLTPLEIGKLAQSYKYYKGVHRNIISHFHSWEAKDRGWNEEGYVLIECEQPLFKVLFDRYWFCIADEIQFEGYIVNPEDIVKIEKWNRQEEGPSKLRALMKLSSLVFNNNRNGFHYSVTTTKKV